MTASINTAQASPGSETIKTSGILQRLAIIALALLLLAVIAQEYTAPLLDGDIFWHLKYAEQMIARGTLIPDHTLYSWTPTNNDTIYCTWLSDFTLYGLYQIGGFGALFALRYFCVALCCTLLLLFARTRSVRSALPALTVIFISLTAIVAGTIIKSEIFSLVAFNLLVFVCVMGRNADRAGNDPRPWFLSVPVILTVWVNAHGGFIFAAPFLIAYFSGAALTRWLAADCALSWRGLRMLLIGFGLCGLVVFLTPYGWRYPAQLVGDFAFHSGPRVGEAWNAAYQRVFAAKWSVISEEGIMMAAALAGLMTLAWRKFRQLDWGLLLAVAFYVPLYLDFIRTTFYVAVVFGYLALDLIGVIDQKASAPARSKPVTRSWRTRATNAGFAIILFVATGSAWHNSHKISSGEWIGFGVSYINPVVESDFLAQSRLGPDLYNVFDSGGYLLWRLDPAYKVMIDPRFFPYKDWFDDLYAFSNGQQFDQFLKKYSAHTAVIDLDRAPLWTNFLQSKDWRLVFYGPTSAIFVDNSISDERYVHEFAPDRFDRLRDANTGFGVFDFALVIGDYTTAWKVLNEINTNLNSQADNATLQRANAVHDGFRLLTELNYDAALPRFAAAKARLVQGWTEPLVLKLLEQRSEAMKMRDADSIARYEAALHEIATSMRR